MKKIMLIIMIILSAYVVSGFYGSETITIAEDIACDEVLVKILVNPSQDEGEYILEPDCTEVSFEDNLKTFKCICTNFNTTLTMTTELNAMGNYSFEIEQYNQTDETTYTETNDGVDNITRVIKLPNDITVERIIQPNEELIYFETEEEYIIIPETNVTFESVTSDSQNINFVAEASGYKCFDIYTENGEPYSVVVDGGSIDFDYENELINFCTNFSTKTIGITWEEPEEEITTTSGGSSGGSTGVVARRLEPNEPIELLLSRNTYSRFKIKDSWHTFKITNIEKEEITVEFKSELIVVKVTKDKPTYIDFDKDGMDDLSIELLEVRKSLTFARIRLIHIIGTTPAEEIVIDDTIIEAEPEEEEVAEEEVDIPVTVEKESKVGIITTVIVILLVVIGVIIHLEYKKKKKQKEKKK